MAKKLIPVNLEGYFAVDFSGRSTDRTVSGDIDDIKNAILEYVSDGGEIEDCQIWGLQEFRDVEIKINKKVEVSINDRGSRGDEEEEEFVILDNGGREVNRFSYEDDAIEELTRLIEEDGREDYYTLQREAIYNCDYSVDTEEDVIINIPDIEVEVAVPEPQDVYMMTKKEIEQELLAIYRRTRDLDERLKELVKMEADF